MRPFLRLLTLLRAAHKYQTFTLWMFLQKLLQNGIFLAVALHENNLLSDVLVRIELIHIPHCNLAREGWY